MDNQVNQPVDAGAEVIAQPQMETEVVKQNVVEQPEPQTEKPQQSQEDNSKYAAARREAEAKSKALEEKIKRLEGLTAKAGYESVDSFTEAYEKQLAYEEEQQRRSELEDQGIDPDIYEQMLQSDPRIKQFNEYQEAQKKSEQNSKNIDDFLDYFEESNGRPYDSKRDTLSKEVEEFASSGAPLVVAYKAAAETALREEIAQLKAKLDAADINARNAESSTGSITPGAQTDSDFISAEVFEANRSDQRWVIKNLEKITKSRKKW